MNIPFLQPSLRMADCTENALPRDPKQRRRHRDFPASHRRDKAPSTTWPANWVLIDKQEPPLGAHLGTPRLGYLHHGIYVGGGYVVHYAGYVHGLLRRPVEEVELAQFRAGRPLWLATNTQSIFDRLEVLRRARSRVGERRYRLLTNNCEHFCEWCLTGVQRSYQVEVLAAWGRRTLVAPRKLVDHLVSRSSARNAIRRQAVGS
jgi:lecithin:retinol acyltransferase